MIITKLQKCQGWHPMTIWAIRVLKRKLLSSKGLPMRKEAQSIVWSRSTRQLADTRQVVRCQWLWEKKVMGLWCSMAAARRICRLDYKVIHSKHNNLNSKTMPSSPHRHTKWRQIRHPWAVYYSNKRQHRWPPRMRVRTVSHETQAVISTRRNKGKEVVTELALMIQRRAIMSLIGWLWSNPLWHRDRALRVASNVAESFSHSNNSSKQISNKLASPPLPLRIAPSKKSRRTRSSKIQISNPGTTPGRRIERLKRLLLKKMRSQSMRMSLRRARSLWHVCRRLRNWSREERLPSNDERALTDNKTKGR